MQRLVKLLAQLKQNLKIVFIYLAEAHADDVWLLGYGIKASKNIEERKSNCDAYLGQRSVIIKSQNIY